MVLKRVCILPTKINALINDWRRSPLTFFYVFSVFLVAKRFIYRYTRLPSMLVCRNSKWILTNNFNACSCPNDGYLKKKKKYSLFSITQFAHFSQNQRFTKSKKNRIFHRTFVLASVSRRASHQQSDCGGRTRGREPKLAATRLMRKSIPLY